MRVAATYHNEYEIYTGVYGYQYWSVSTHLAIGLEIMQHECMICTTVITLKTYLT